MRRVLVRNLAARFDGGNLALLGTVQAAIGAVDRAALEGGVDQFAEIAVHDGPGRRVVLVLRAGGAETHVPLSPADAVALAGELITAALPRLGQTA